MNYLQINSINSITSTPSKTNYKKSFRGAELPVRDTVEIHEQKKKKEKKNNIGTTLLLSGLAIGGAIIAYLKFHKTSKIKPNEELSAELKEVQQLFKDIFKRDINAEETKDFAKRYKKIIDSKTSDNDREYCEKLIDEICKDRKTQKPRINDWISDKSKVQKELKNGGMATAPDGTYIDIYAFNYRNVPNNTTPERELFESLFHETHHVKQKEIIYRTDKEFFLDNLLDKFVCNGEGKMYKDILRKNHGNKEKTLEEVKKLIKQQENQHWGIFAPFDKNSAEYKEGLRLIEGTKNYKPFWKCAPNGEYKKQIIEEGAHSDGEKAKRLFDLLKNIMV